MPAAERSTADDRRRASPWPTADESTRLTMRIKDGTNEIDTLRLRAHRYTATRPSVVDGTGPRF